MSHEAVDWAMSQTLACVTKMVLLCLAYRHNHRTGQLNPSLDTIAYSGGLGRSTAARELDRLERLGLIEREPGRGRRHATSYRLKLRAASCLATETVPLRDHFDGANSPATGRIRGARAAPKQSRCGTEIVPLRDRNSPGAGLEKGIKKGKEKGKGAREVFTLTPPPVNAKPAADAAASPTSNPKRKPRTHAPKELDISPEMYGWAKATLGLDERTVERETDKFLDHFAANGEAKADWFAAWRNWMRKAVEFDRRSRATH